jgi:hypothetical protein
VKIISKFTSNEGTFRLLNMADEDGRKGREKRGRENYQFVIISDHILGEFIYFF